MYAIIFAVELRHIEALYNISVCSLYDFHLFKPSASQLCSDFGPFVIFIFAFLSHSYSFCYSNLRFIYISLSSFSFGFQSSCLWKDMSSELWLSYSVYLAVWAFARARDVCVSGCSNVLFDRSYQKYASTLIINSKYKLSIKL